MPSLIDEFVVELGLDPKKFIKGKKEIDEAWRKMQSDAEDRVKRAEEHADKISNAFSMITRKALTFGALLAGGHTLESFVQHVVQGDAALGRMALTLGINATELKSWQTAAELMGGSAEGISHTIGFLTGEIQGFQVDPSSHTGLLAYMTALRIGFKKSNGDFKSGTELLLDITNALSKMDPARAAVFANMFHIDNDTLAMLIRHSKEMPQVLKQASELNKVTDANAASAQALSTSWENATHAIQGFFASIIRESGVEGAATGLLNWVANIFTRSDENKKRAREFTDALAGGDTAETSPASSSSNGDKLSAAAAAIASIESAGSGGYKALGPVTHNGDRAYGKYQVMGANVPTWTKEALGYAMTPQQFLNDPAAQDTVFRYKFGDYTNKYGSMGDAASMWFTGKPLAQGAGRHDILGTSGADYVRKFWSGMGNSKGASSDMHIQNLNVTLPGVTSAGEFIDQLQGIQPQLKRQSKAASVAGSSS